MHSEWPAEHDTALTAPTWTPPSGVTDGAGHGTAPPDPEGPAGVAGQVAVEQDPAVDGEVDGARAEAEEDLHRSAVDAVDGLLDEVELALARLDDGTYGRCEGCGAPIDDERLAELPIVRTCGRCDEVDGGSSAPEPVEPVTA